MEHVNFDYSPSDLLTNYPDVLELNHLCKILNISAGTAYKILKNGENKSLKVGRAYRIPKTSVLKYLHFLS